MKLHLPISLRKCVLSLFSVAGVLPATLTPAEAGRLHADVSIQTYTDFGQNMGRYVVGDRVNALLDYIRQEDRGIRVYYTDGTAPYTIENTQGMINFSGTGDNGAYVAIAPNAIATVLHNAPNNASFAERYVGSEHAINYSTIDIRYSNTFRLAAPNGYDYMLQRQSKIVTDAEMNPLTTVTDVTTLGGQKLYHSGSGSMQLQGPDGEVKSLTGAHQYIVGDISSIYQSETGYSDDGSGNFRVAVNIDELYYNTGASERTPMPNLGLTGDSGSPYYHYNTEEKRYEYIGSLSVGNDVNRNYVLNNAEWTSSTLNGFNATVNMSATSVVYLNAIDTEGETKTDSNGNRGKIWYGTVTNADGTPIADAEGAAIQYNGIKSGANTWADLSDLKDTQNWYAYDADHYHAEHNPDGKLMQSVTDLFFTENLVFTSTAEENSIVLNDTVDLGVGYAEFNAEGEGKSVFTISSAGGKNNQFNHAGYVINDGAEVHLQLTGSAEHMFEWRRIGAGDMYIEGAGKNDVLLNIGGSGKTYLNRAGDAEDNEYYAAYNVLVSTGATVVIKDIKQIKRDLTFGVGGGTLDMSGNDMKWYTTNGETPREGCFTINALTEEAMIHNGAGAATLTYMESGATTYLGSFSDSESGSLVIDYQGGGTWTLHSIHTDLTNNTGSGLVVTDGSVVLAGSLTRHGMGSVDGMNQERITRSNDWHYADAAMNVTVKGSAAFELGSHARLKGDVTVETDGTFIMREGVQHRYEYVEGGVNQDDTYEFAEYYGHTGSVALAGEMQVKFSEGTTANTTYSGKLSGAGLLSVDTGTDGGTLTLSGDNSAFTGTREIIRGGVIVKDANALGDTTTNKWKVAADGWIAAQALSAAALLSHLDADSAGTLALSADTPVQLELNGHQGLFVGAEAGKTVHYGLASEALVADAAGNWKLGGGGGTLVVDALLTGEKKNLILGSAASASGTVILANDANDFSGLVSLVGNGIILKATGAALGDSTLALSSGSALWTTDSMAVQRITSDSEGLFLVNEMGDQDVDLSSHQSLFLGASMDMRYTGQIALASDGDYRFSALNGATLTVETQLDSAHSLLVDSKGHSGSSVVLAGSVPQRVNNLTVDGEIALVLGQQTSAAGDLTVGSGASLDLAGHNLSSLGATSINGRVIDSVGGGELTWKVDSGSQTVSDSVVVDIDNLRKTGAGTLVLDSAEAHVDSYYVDGGTLQLGDTLALKQEDNFVLSGGTTLNVGTREINFNITTEADAGTVNLYQTGAEYTTPFDEKHTNYTIVSGNITTQGNSEVRFTGAGVYELRSNVYGGENGTLSIANKQINLYATSGSDSGEVSQGVSFLGTLRVSNNATLRSLSWWDNLTHSINRLLIDEGRTLTVSESAWNTIWNIKALTGSGTLRWDSTATHTYTSRMILSGENDFSGSIILNRNNTAWGSQRTHNAIIELASDGAARNAIFSLNGVYNSEASLAINTENAQIRGLSGNAYSYVYAGAAPEISGGLPSTGRSATLTIDTAAGKFYTYSGDVGSRGDTVENGLSLVKTGSGTQKIAGNAYLGNISVEAGTLELTEKTTSIAGNVSLAGGASLSMGSFVLSSGKTFAVVSSESGSPATFTGNLSMAGGTLAFDAKGLDAATTALNLGGDVTCPSTSKLHIENYRYLKSGATYTLATGNWETVVNALNVTGLRFFDRTISTNASGHLQIAVTLSDGYVAWAGDSTVLQPENKVIFFGVGEDAAVSIGRNAEVGSAIFDNENTLSFGSSNGSTLAFDSVEKTSDAALEINTGVSVGTMKVQENTSLSGSGELSVDSLRLAAGKTLNVERNATLVFSSATAGFANANITGEGTVGLNLTNTWGNTINLSAFEGDTYVKSGCFTLNGSTFGNTLRLADGANLQVTGNMTLSKNLVLDGTSELHLNNGSELTINGTVSGEGTYKRKGSGILRFNNTVSLGGFDHTTYGCKTLFNADSTVGYLNVTGGDLEIAKGKTLTVRNASDGFSSGNLIGTGTLSLAMSDNWGNVLNVGSAFKGITHVRSGKFSLGDRCYYGSELRMGAGTGIKSDVNITLSSNVAAEGNLDVQVTEGKTLQVNGSATAAGKLNKTGSGELRFSGRSQLDTLETIDGEVVLAYAGEEGNTIRLLDGSKNRTATGTLRLAQKVHATVAGDIWGRSASSIVLEEGAELTCSQDSVSFSNKGAAAEATLSYYGEIDDEYGLADAWELTNGHLAYNGSGNATLGNKLTASSVENAGSGTLQVTNGNNTLSGVVASGGNVDIFNAAPEMTVEDMEVATGLSVSVMVGASGTTSANAEVVVTGTSLLGGNSTLNADLTLAEGATLDMNSLESGAVLLNGTLSIGGQIIMGENLLATLNEKPGEARSVTIFTGLDAVDMSAVTGSPTSNRVWAGVIFSNMSGSSYCYLNYVAETGSLVAEIVPEPATVTLSLLALAALAARRRRKSGVREKNHPIITVAQGIFPALRCFFAQYSTLLYIKRRGFCFLLQKCRLREKLFFGSNQHIFVWVTAGNPKILKLFCKNMLDVSLWF